MIFPDPKGKLQTVKQRLSSGKIKIHQHSSVISLLLGEWLTDAQAWGSPTQQQRGNSLSGENNIPADCLNLSSPRVLYFPSFDPALPPSPFNSQSAHMRRSARRLTNDKLLLGLLSKISAVWLEGVVMGGGGLRSQTKPSEHPQIKRDTHFSGCRPSKRIHLDQKCLSAGGSAPHRSKTLNMVLSVCSDRLHVASLWFSSNVHKRAELIFAKVTKPNPEICFCAALWRLWNTITFSPNPPLPVCSQLNKPLYPVIPLLSATLSSILRTMAPWLLLSFSSQPVCCYTWTVFKLTELFLQLFTC